MATRIFMTGITGYIGGQALATLIAKHPEHTIVGLVQTEEKKQQILARHPSLEVIIGDLDSDQILIEESKKADIVIKGTYLHLSGAGSVFDHSLGYGKFPPKIWDDIEDLTAITTFKQPVFHAKADRLVLDLGKKLKIRTAILEPPMVYGNSDSLSDRSISLPLLVDIAKARGTMFQVGEATQCISAVHVKDLADVFAYFVDEALKDEEGSRVEWGEKGVYYVEAREYVFADVVDAVAKEMHNRGGLETAGVAVLTEAEALEVHPWALVVFATNMRTRASILRALGWVPKQPGLIETVSGLFKR
ncbi:uncharacterized protein RSE6_13182 [Rhynchosporium secalis]|uniref:Nucleoside-diphosphate-sugar epimerase n=1 Tax=Rhynchosporium secalis TaxID=38038 RepID=A0A1E1MS86_RHYSE|nr:uncharacterized protein RSE6_13182 [Rhynchosporium secalis]